MDARKVCPGGVPSELWLTDQEFKFISDTLVDSSFKVERLSDEVSRPLAVVNVSQPIPKPKGPIDPKDACPRGVRSELWLTEEEYRFITEALGNSGFKIERFDDETPRKSAAVSVSQASLKSSNRSLSRQGKVTTSGRLGTLPQQGGRNLLPDNERNEYRRLVQHIIRTHKMAAQPFLFPVPDTVFGYYDIIKKPSDLTTIRQRLDSSSYATRGDFEADFLQMVWNAYIFNPPISDVFKAALELHSAFLTGLQKSVIALNDQKRSETYEKIESARRQRKIVRRVSEQPSRQILKKSTTEEELRKKLEFLQKVVSRQNASSSTATPREETPLSDRQLDQLANDLEQLDPKYVPQVASVLRGEPTARVSEGQLDLSIHELPAGKQKELQRLMEKLKAQEALRGRLSERVRDHSDSETEKELAAKRRR